MAQVGATAALIVAALVLLSRMSREKRGVFAGLSMGRGTAQSATCKQVPFGPETVWLAIRCGTSERVVDGIRLCQARWSDWEMGLEEAKRRGQAFVSQPVDGWIFVISASLPGMGDGGRKDALTPLIVKLSRKLDTTVQYFGSLRAPAYCGWIWADRGQVRRAFVTQGGIALADIGEQTPVEKEIALPDEEAVMKVAGAWSLDPRSLGGGKETVLGWLGRI